MLKLMLHSVRPSQAVGVALLALVALFRSSCSTSVHAQAAQRPPTRPHTRAQVIRGASQSRPVTPQTSDRDLRTLPVARPWRPGDPVRFNPNRYNPRPDKVERARPPRPASRRDPLLDIQQAARPETAQRMFSPPDLNFDGQGFTGPFPPDTVGDVGPNHYIQAVNAFQGTQITVYEKSSGTPLAGPLRLVDLWAAGGACGDGLGDPIVLYDALADRWLLSEFSAGANSLCVYISQTNNPITGGWFLYPFPTPGFPDYPKYAVWPDAYYVSSNEFPTPAAYALERDKMLNGEPATFQRFTVPDLAGFGFQALIPADLDGPPPPAGSPAFFVRHRDDEVHDITPDPAQDFLEIWEFSVDFSNPPNSTMTGPTNIPVSEFDSDLCGLFSFACFPQPNDPGPRPDLDPLREVVMWRAQYRDFGTHEALVGNFVTDVDGTDHGGVRWFELRKTGMGAWVLYQEGTVAPDSDHRWMGSIAMDGAGNMALGYSVSGPNTFPSIRYVGRLAVDPLGTMPQGETTLIAGTGSQIANRWGDYSAMSVDPVDDCTFWYTNEYTNPSHNWSTRVGRFNFDSCDQNLNLPRDPSPRDGEIGVGTSPTLSWTGGDMSVSYDVYFGTAPNPPLVSSDQPDTSFVPGTLANGTSYFWRVVTMDMGVPTQGPTWQFTVGNPVPTLSSSSPDVVIASTGDFTLVARGMDFISGSQLRWNAANRTTTFHSASDLTASIPAGDISTPGLAFVDAFNPSPGGGVSNAIPIDILSAITVSNSDFESGDQSFTATGVINTVTWQRTDHRGTDPGHSSINSFFFGDPTKCNVSNPARCDYDTGFQEGACLVSPAIAFGSGPHELMFNYFLETEGGGFFDNAAVQISGDGGPFSTVLDNGSVGGLLDATGAWQPASVDISGFAGQTVTIQFCFDTRDDLFNSFEGWYVDDVQIRQGLTTPPTSLVLTGHTISTTHVFEATDYITADNFQITAPGNVSFRVSSSGTIALGNGFAVGEGATFTAERVP